MQGYNFKSFIRVSIPIVFLLVFTVILNKTVISNPDQIRQWLAGFGGYAIIAYIFVQSAAIIIAPIGGSAFALAVLALFGPLNGTLLIYLVTTPAYIVNFLLARRYGKKVVHKLIGIEGEALIQRFMNKFNLRKLILMKIFLNGYFDFIAYGVGLSDMKVSDFILINVIAGIPTSLFTWAVMRFAPSFLSAAVIFYIVPALFAFAYLSISHLKNKRAQPTENLLEHEI